MRKFKTTNGTVVCITKATKKSLVEMTRNFQENPFEFKNVKITICYKNGRFESYSFYNIDKEKISYSTIKSITYFDGTQYLYYGGFYISPNGKVIASETESIKNGEEIKEDSKKEEDNKMTKLTQKEFVEKMIANGLENDTMNIWGEIAGISVNIELSKVFGNGYEEEYPFQASEEIEGDINHIAWDYLYDEYAAQVEAACGEEEQPTRTFLRDNPFMKVTVQKISHHSAIKELNQFIKEKSSFDEREFRVRLRDGNEVTFTYKSNWKETFKPEEIEDIIICDDLQYQTTSSFVLYSYGDIVFSEEEYIDEEWIEVPSISPKNF